MCFQRGLGCKSKRGSFQLYRLFENCSKMFFVLFFLGVFLWSKCKLEVYEHGANRRKSESLVKISKGPPSLSTLTSVFV